MWLASEKDDWLSDTTSDQNRNADESTLTTQSRPVAPIDIIQDTSQVPSDLRNLPDAPPCSIHVSDNVAYYALRIQEKKVFVSLANAHELMVPYHLFGEIQLAHATMAMVVVILFDSSSHEFEGYAIIDRVPSQSSTIKGGLLLVQASLIRRATVQYAQVSHIRDEYGLQGRPISSVRDGSRLGVPAGRVLCRFIDKKAFNDDPVHYRDQPNIRNNVIGGIHPNIYPPKRIETDVINMTFSEYLGDFYRRRKDGEPVPSLDHLVYR